MIAIHQSQFMPWAPYISKIVQSDVFVVLDSVQFQKNGVQNRNKIKTPKGAEWLTIPVSVHLGDPINEVKVSNPSAAYGSVLKTLEANYSRSVHFKEVYEPLEDIFKKGAERLHDLNASILTEMLAKIRCKTKIVCSSGLDLKKSKEDLVIEIIKKFNETKYLSGKGALAYMQLDKFKAQGIEVYLSEFDYAPYPQQWETRSSFAPDLSVVDLYFNALGDASDYIVKNATLKRIC